jgi:hypothetical protein
MYLIVTYYVASPKEVPLWDAVKRVVIIFQNAAVLEVCAFLLTVSDMFFFHDQHLVSS